jgi:hypothetical protein
MGPATLSPERSALDELEFADLWCDDAELLRAEFDAIVAAEWPDRPEVPPRRRIPGVPDPGGRNRGPGGSQPERTERRWAQDRQPRQRSPPAADGGWRSRR